MALVAVHQLPHRSPTWTKQVMPKLVAGLLLQSDLLSSCNRRPGSKCHTFSLRIADRGMDMDAIIGYKRRPGALHSSLTSGLMGAAGTAQP
jgi:hypothetical protein